MRIRRSISSRLYIFGYCSHDLNFWVVVPALPIFGAKNKRQKHKKEHNHPQKLTSFPALEKEEIPAVQRLKQEAYTQTQGKREATRKKRGNSSKASSINKSIVSQHKNLRTHKLQAAVHEA